MKHITTAFFLSSICLLAEPRLITNSRISPHSDIKIMFDEAMVSKDAIGKPQPNTILKISPAWPGKIEWTSTNTAKFLPTSTPKINIEYTFTTAKGLTDTEGIELEATDLGSRKTNDFEIQRSRRINSTFSSPRPGHSLCFSEDIDSIKVAPFFFYLSADGKRAAAEVKQATWGDIQSTYYYKPSYTTSFKAIVAKSKGIEYKPERLKKDSVLKNCIIVRPIDTLPAGKNWKLNILAGLPDTHNNAKLTKNQTFSLGNKPDFKITSFNPQVYPDSPRHVSINFNADISKNTKVTDLAKSISVSPKIENMEIKIFNRNIEIHGDFNKVDQYRVIVEDGINAKHGLTLSKRDSQWVTFTHLKARLSIPSFSRAQLSKGQRKYPVSTVNMKNVRVRIKAMTTNQAVRAQQGYHEYLTSQEDYNGNYKKRTPLPFSLVGGKTVYDMSHQLDNNIDTSLDLVLDWNKILPKKRDNLTFFLDVQGSPKNKVQQKSLGTHYVQSFIQLTDIGLAWKKTDSTTLIYCYSCETGKPLPNVNLATYTKEADLKRNLVTNEEGIAMLTFEEDETHITASLKKDSFILPMEREMDTHSMWRFPVKYEWYPFAGWKREALIFTDRKLYKPGETVRLKGIIRERKDNKHRVPVEKAATLTIYDPDGRALVEENITLSDKGSFDHIMALPKDNIGTYNIKLAFKIPKEGNKSERTWNHRWQLRQNSQFYSRFSVQEFRKNAFKVSSTLKQNPTKPLGLTASITAQYYMGTAVAEGNTDWYITSSDTGFYPKDYRNFLFGNHLSYDPNYWDHYYGYDNGEYYETKNQTKQNGNIKLTKDGKVSLEIDIEESKFPTTKNVKLLTEVTDGREQTISSRSQFTIHPSSHYLGIHRIDSLVRVNEAHTIKFTAVDTKGKPSKADFSAKLTINKLTYDSVKTVSKDGKATVNNEEKEKLTLEKNITIKAGQIFEFPFTAEESGTYTVTVSSEDSEGNRIATATKLTVYGSNSYPWSVNTGMKIELTPEMRQYKPGDTARILVMTPIEGTALVTVERSGVMRQFIQEIKASSPVIEVPLTHEYSPNVYVSVLLIRGAKQSNHQFKEPALKLGYCNIQVENTTNKLNVVFDSPEESYRPGATVTLSGTVTNYQNKPVKDAEITLYAEDNGVLDVIGYKMPKPHKFFNSELAMRVRTGTSLSSFLTEMAPEDMDMINESIQNKGYTIGGGGENEEAPKKNKVRSNFDPCALWSPNLATNADGKFSITFKVPESLTSYRVMAVSLAGDQQFGSAKSEIVINKPLMLEPLAPRFANEGDTKRTKLYIANNSKFEGTWKVTLKSNSLCHMINSDKLNETSKLIDLKSGGSAYLYFDTKFVDTGKAKWTWTAEPASLVGSNLNQQLREDLSDAMENNFNVIYPRPIIRTAKFRKLGPNQQNLLQGIDPELLDGKGHIQLGLSNNLLFRAEGAAEHLLKYPYG